MQTRTIIGIGFAILLGSAVTIHTGVKFHDGSPLTAADIAASWHEIVVPRPGVLSARQNWYTVVDSVEAPDATTVVFKLKFVTSTFLPSLADPYTQKRSSTKTHTGSSST